MRLLSENLFTFQQWDEMVLSEGRKFYMLVLFRLIPNNFLNFCCWLEIGDVRTDAKNMGTDNMVGLISSDIFKLADRIKLINGNREVELLL